VLAAYDEVGPNGATDGVGTDRGAIGAGAVNADDGRVEVDGQIDVELAV